MQAPDRELEVLQRLVVGQRCVSELPVKALTPTPSANALKLWYKRSETGTGKTQNLIERIASYPTVGTVKRLFGC